MTEESRYTIDDAPEPPVAEDASEPTGARPGETAEQDAVAGGEAQELEDAPPAESEGARPKEAWRDVLTQIDALGDSIGRWARAAVNDPENRRHATEIKEKLDAVGTKIGSAVDEATHTEIGRSVADAADKTGKAIADVSGKVAQEAAPAVVSVLSGLAGFLGKAAEKVGQAAERPAGASEPEAAEEGAEPEAPATEPAAERPEDETTGE